jgi:hypothetical protein
MTHRQKIALAAQIYPILVQNGAVSYSVARDILQLAIEMLGNSVVLSPPESQDKAEPKPIPPEPFQAGQLARIPDEHCRAKCYISKDGKLTLSLGMFAVDEIYTHAVDIPFSDFAQGFASIADFERMVVDLINGLTVQREEVGIN